MAGRLGLYDDRAKRVLALAQDEAWRVFHHPAIGPEHLLLAVIRAGTGDRPGSGSVGDALNSLGVDVTKAREALEALSGRGDAQHQPDEVVSFTPEGDKVIDLAPAEAKLLNAEKVTDTHVLLAVLREPGKAEAMLKSLGLSTEAVRQKILGESGG
ncbi:MAG TPA: Clp protease N-terminal domain-containing protein [Candidatus Limnocylindria bacterium]|jgi:ATP-dependent Clp protease ATP-binding subunit ClpA|nr:Clp protease N-terminal domain-containing protein [Candidatus Limnocylindria bacterium]